MNRSAIAAMIGGIAGPSAIWIGANLGGPFALQLFAAGGVLSAIGLVAGLESQSDIKKSGGHQRVWGMGLAGMLLGLLGLLLGGYYVVRVVGCTTLWGEQPRAGCSGTANTNVTAPYTPPPLAPAPFTPALPTPAPFTPAPAVTAFPTVVDAALQFVSSRSKAPTVGPVDLLGAIPGASLTPLVFTSQNEIDVNLEYGGDGRPVVTSSIGPTTPLYGSFGSLLYSSHAAAVSGLSSGTGALINTSSIPFAGGTATVGTVAVVPADSAITWSQGSWSLSVEGPDRSTDIATGQHLASYFGSHPLVSGPGVYAVTVWPAGENSVATWVQDAAQVNVGVRNPDPTMAAQMSLTMHTWPPGNG